MLLSSREKNRFIRMCARGFSRVFTIDKYELFLNSNNDVMCGIAPPVCKASLAAQCGAVIHYVFNNRCNRA